MTKLIIAIAFLILISSSVYASNTIAQIKPQWQVASADNGYEYIDFQFTTVDDTHTLISLSLNLNMGLSKQEILNLIKQNEGNLKKIPIEKIFGAGVTLDRADIDVTSPTSVEFIITHPSIKEDGWEVKIGTASATVSTSTDADAIWTSNNCRPHFANTKYWTVFFDGGDPVIYSSSDKSTWNSQGDLNSTASLVEATYHWAVRYDGTNMIVAMGDLSANKVYYRNCTLDSDGGVTWNANDALIVTDGSAQRNTTIGFDSDGFPWVGAITPLNEITRVNEGDALDTPSWTTRNPANIPNPPFSNVSIQAGALFQGVDSGDMVFLACIMHTSRADSKDIQFNTWDASGTAWDGWGEAVSDDLNNTAAIGTKNGWSAVKLDNGEIHIVYVDLDGHISHVKGSDAMPPSWSSVDADVTTLTSHTKVTLTQNADDLVLIYDKGDEKLYYREWSSGGGWGSESDLKTDTTALSGAITSSETVVNDEVLVMWQEGTGSPWDIEFDVIDMAVDGGIVVLRRRIETCNQCHEEGLQYAFDD